MSGKPPAFTGLLVHHDVEFGFSLLVPDGWRRRALEGSPTGVFYAPDEADSATGLAIEAVDLGTRVRPDDLPSLKRGFLDGLRGLSDCRIEYSETEAVGDLLTLEARVLYVEHRIYRKRWVRLLYHNRTQLRLIAQAATVERFAYWEPMFFEAMRTVHFGTFV